MSAAKLTFPAVLLTLSAMSDLNLAIASLVLTTFETCYAALSPVSADLMLSITVKPEEASIEVLGE